MKCVAVVLIALVACVLATSNEDCERIHNANAAHQIHELCLQQSGVTAEQTQKIEAFEHSDEKEVHQYVYCAAEKMGIFTDDKGYNLEKVIKQLEYFSIDVSKARDAIESCIDTNEQKSTPVDWAFRGYQCLMNTRIGDSLKQSGHR